ncbi:MAG TPA: metallophosphoesterase [Allosphingosinicella sp.]|nr:metallophosphoesterase [Allosphingosinicella sp.]
MAATILHVSDVHFGAHDDQGAQQPITHALVEAVQKELWVPDLCVFSGDLAYSAQPEEFERGAEWLVELARLSSNRLFIVPGNHDVRRRTDPDFLRDARSDRNKYWHHRNTLAESHEHLKPFKDWHAKLAERSGIEVLSDWSNPFGNATSLVLDGMRFNFIGLNTAAVSCDDEDKDKLIIDLTRLHELLATHGGTDDCTIAVGHHPVEWLADWNAEEVSTILKRKTGANLYLHGHQHETSARSTANALGQSIAVLESGAAYHGAKYPQYFSFYQFDFEDREIDLRTYGYSINSGEWAFQPMMSESFVAPIPRRRSRRTAAEKVALDRGPAGPPPAVEVAVDRPEPADSALSERRRARNSVAEEVRCQRERAETAHSKIQLLLQHLPMPKENLFDSHSRVKTLKSAIRKIGERREKNQQYTARDLTDMCGFRLVSYFQSDVGPMVEELLKAVRASESPDETLKLRTHPEKWVTVHTYRLEDDPLSTIEKVREIVRDFAPGHEVIVQPSVTGYSSVHLIIDVDVSDGSEVPEWLAVEFQLRSVLEEVWGQLDHKFRYGPDRGKPAPVSSSWKMHLNVLKAQFDACVQYLDLIKALKVREKAAAVVPKDRVPSLSKPEKVLAQFRSSLPPDVFEALEAAFELWKQADGARQFAASPTPFREAAHEFASLLELAEAKGNGGSAGWPVDDFRYAVRMEQAYMLTASGDPVDKVAAEGIYQDILADRPSNAAAMYRLGDLLRLQGNHDDAIALFQRASAIAAEESYKGFYDGEKDFVIDKSRLSLALSQFRKFEADDTDRDFDARAELIESAVKTARDVLVNHRSEGIGVQALNDYLYYGWEQWNLLSERGLEGSISMDRFRECTHELERQYESVQPKSYDYEDTLARLHRMLGDREKALKAAMRTRDCLVRIAEKRSGKSFSDRGEQSYQWAQKVSDCLANGDEKSALAFAMDLCQAVGTPAAR